MSPKDSKNYLDWLKKAEEDELAGIEILKSGRLSAPACFHFQQMAEKLLKSLIIFRGKNFPKVHDLLELETILFDSDPDIKKLDKELDILSTYYFETRYPGDFPEFSQQDANEARSAAQKIKGFVLEKIGVDKIS